jgi:hypothetical protein
MSKTVQLETDAFSAGQIESKIWAADELEKVAAHTNILKITILGGWYGLLHFILKIRGKQNIEWCRSYDLDPMACSVANVVNNTWESKEWAFKSFPQNANTFKYSDETNCVINTSTEHFESNIWFENIPKNMLCVFQGNNLIIEDHVQRPENLEHFKSMFPLQTILFEGEKYFDFKENPYTRYMIIGHK